MSDSIEDLPSTISSKVVPTEYDIERGDGSVTLIDDRGRRFTAESLSASFDLAELNQDPSDPFHHEPFPPPSEVRDPARLRGGIAKSTVVLSSPEVLKYLKDGRVNEQR